jgi:hypothetical protein
MVWLSADYTASTASILNLLTLSLDRYYSITAPLKYLGKRTRSRALIMIAIAWSLSLLWVLPITGWSYLFNGGVRYVPVDKCNTEYDKNIAFKVATAICNFYLPLLAMILINAKIYLVIRRRYHNPIMKYSSPNNLLALGNACSNDETRAFSSNGRSAAGSDRRKSTASQGFPVDLGQNSSVTTGNKKSNNGSGLYYQIKDNANRSTQHDSSPSTSSRQHRNRSLSLDATRLNNMTFASQLVLAAAATKKQRPAWRRHISQFFSQCGQKSAKSDSSCWPNNQQQKQSQQQQHQQTPVSTPVRSTLNIPSDVRMSKLTTLDVNRHTTLNIKSTSTGYLDEVTGGSGNKSPSILSTRINNKSKSSVEKRPKKDELLRPTSQTLAISSESRKQVTADAVNSTCSNKTAAVSATGGNTSPMLSMKGAKIQGMSKSKGGSGSDSKINRKGYMNKQEKAFKVN